MLHMTLHAVTLAAQKQEFGRSGRSRQSSASTIVVLAEIKQEHEPVRQKPMDVPASEHDTSPFSHQVTCYRGETSVTEPCGTGVCYFPRLSCCPGYSATVLGNAHVCGPLVSRNFTLDNK